MTKKKIRDITDMPQLSKFDKLVGDLEKDQPIFNGLANEVLKVMMDILINSPDDKTRMNGARYMLDRIYGKPTTPIKLNSNNDFNIKLEIVDSKITKDKDITAQ